MKHGKKYVDSVKLIDSLTAYDPADACDLVCKTSKAKFDETIEISVRLGVDPRHADQQVRGAVVLPHGTGRTIRVLVVTKGDKVGMLTKEQVQKIAEIKRPDVNATDLEAIMSMVKGTARSMGITVEE